MITCSPQRYLANNRNVARTATLTPSSVEPIADKVLSIPVARDGTAQVSLTGSYSGNEEAVYEVEIVDDTATTKLISAPIASGSGSGSLSNISSSLPAQTITVELANAGIPTLASGTDFDGVALKARIPGDTGNDIFIIIDQAPAINPLTFTPTDYSLLNDLKAGDGGPGKGLEGPEFDYNTKILGADKQIPLDAHRISFENDSQIYLQYKQYSDSKWKYYLVPELKRDVPKGSRVNFVTGGRTITVSNGGSPVETYTGIITLYDFLNALKTESALIDVDGVVANDRSPTGQASIELSSRTDAHAQPSTGKGSAAATGFINYFVNPGANTELVTATCFAVGAADYPLAHLGGEYWQLKGSVSGDLGFLQTGVPYAGTDFGMTIPVRLPFGFGVQKGRFTVTDITYATREVGETEPPICMKRLTLGVAAVDQTITLTYTARPSGDCACGNVPAPALSASCLGLNLVGGDVPGTYQEDTRERLEDLYDFEADQKRSNSLFITAPGLSGLEVAAEEAWLEGTPFALGTNAQNVAVESFSEIVAAFEQTIALIDPLESIGSPNYRDAGLAAWDTAFTEFQADVVALSDDSSSIIASRYRSRLRWVLISANISPLGGDDASILASGDGCWRDYPEEAYYWEVTGTNGGTYGPAFNNQAFHSSRKATNDGKYYTTKEFGFVVSVKCPADLRVDDQITLDISDAAWGATYQIGDELTLPIVAAQPLFLAGGQDGNQIMDWYVGGSLTGALPNFVYDPDAPAPYDTADLDLTLVVGGIPFAQGDKFVFAIEGGHYRWRKDGGSWSSSIAIPAAPAVLDSGLSITFTNGAYPSFVASDLFKFRALQPYAVSNLQTPTAATWKWSGASPTLALDFGVAKAMDMISIALHTLPAGTTLTLQGGSTTSVLDWTETLTWRAGVIAQLLSQVRTSRYVKLTLATATGGAIGWLWLGEAFSTELSADVQLRKSYAIERADAGLYQGGAFLGKTTAGQIDWTEAAMNEEDAAGIETMLDWIKSNDDEPFVLVPQVTRPDAFLVRVALDDILFDEISDYNRDVAFDRRYSVNLPLQGVLA